MIVQREVANWPKNTMYIEHNNVSVYIYPTINGLCVNTTHKFLVEYSYTDEQFEIEFQETKLK